MQRQTQREEQMNELGRNVTFSAPRRGLFGRLAGSLAIGLVGLTSVSGRAETDTAATDGPNWPGKL
jgi:hypothetical protein